MLIAGNWKMNGLAGEAAALARQLGDAVSGEPASSAAPMVVFPPALHIGLIAPLLAESGIGLGGQDCHAEESGAHTGDIAAEMLADLGCDWVLVGHSERRTDHGETDSAIRAKAEAGIRAGLRVMLCVGETLDQRQVGAAETVVAEQLLQSLPAKMDASGLAIAYEPVWAIGSGLVPSMEEIADMHQLIRKTLGQHGKGLEKTPILYGGSVKPSNAAAILGLEGVDGALVGGASLKAEDFLAIRAAASVS